jgi:hypothetical protein
MRVAREIKEVRMCVWLSWLFGWFTGEAVDNPGQTGFSANQHVDNPGQTPM